MGWLILIIVSLVISVVCSWWCATRALAKGYSPVVWGIVGFIFPIISVIIMVFLPRTDRAA
jgi:membrane associated rhomboid family serine protease